VSEGERNPDNFCYRHPDRESYILCQRCGRTICAQCQTQAAVGVHCPECVKDARANAPKRKPAIVTAFRRGSSKPVVTFTLIGVNVFVYVLQLLFPDAMFQLFAYAPEFTSYEPWTMITAAFLHAPFRSLQSLLHIGFNMYALFVFGPLLEHILGRVRFLALYFIAAFGGSVAVLVLSPTGAVVGASGAIFGLLGAFFVIERGRGGNTTQLLVLIVLNFAIGFLLPNVSWEGHLGGLLAGAAIGFVYLQTRRRDQLAWQILFVAIVAVVLVAIAIVRTATL
jgi:membrane associated rhomboid family serine protease